MGELFLGKVLPKADFSDRGSQLNKRGGTTVPWGSYWHFAMLGL
jgi:hypothetical protein